MPRLFRINTAANKLGMFLCTYHSHTHIRFAGKKKKKNMYIYMKALLIGRAPLKRFGWHRRSRIKKKKKKSSPYTENTPEIKIHNMRSNNKQQQQQQLPINENDPYTNGTIDIGLSRYINPSNEHVHFQFSRTDRAVPNCLPVFALDYE